MWNKHNFMIIFCSYLKLNTQGGHPECNCMLVYHRFNIEGVHHGCILHGRYIYI